MICEFSERAPEKFMVFGLIGMRVITHCAVVVVVECFSAVPRKPYLTVDDDVVM